MLSCGLGGAHLLWTILPKAWAYLDRVVGPLLGTVANGFATINPLVVAVAGGLLATLLIRMVASGLLIVAVTTLGDNIILGDCCMSPALLPNLGSGMGSWKVTFILFRMLFIFCNTSISSDPLTLMRCRRFDVRLPTAWTIWSLATHQWL
jgi:hypothetical protein